MAAPDGVLPRVHCSLRLLHAPGPARSWVAWEAPWPVWAWLTVCWTIATVSLMAALGAVPMETFLVQQDTGLQGCRESRDAKQCVQDSFSDMRLAMALLALLALLQALQLVVYVAYRNGMNSRIAWGVLVACLIALTASYVFPMILEQNVQMAVGKACLWVFLLSLMFLLLNASTLVWLGLSCVVRKMKQRRRAATTNGTTTWRSDARTTIEVSRSQYPSGYQTNTTRGTEASRFIPDFTSTMGYNSAADFSTAMPSLMQPSITTVSSMDGPSLVAPSLQSPLESASQHPPKSEHTPFYRRDVHLNIRPWRNPLTNRTGLANTAVFIEHEEPTSDVDVEGICPQD